MASIKMTFSLDDDTAERLRVSAERLGKPKSQVVREAIRDYSDRIGRLSEEERLRALRQFDEVVPRIPDRPLAAVESELQALRAARRRGGRRRPGEDGS